MGPNPNATSMGALLRSQALGKSGGAGGGGAGGAGGNNLPGPASGPLSLAARRAGGRPNLGSMGMPPSAPGGLSRPGAPTGGLAGRRGPPGGLNLSSMTGGEKSGSKFSDFSNIMCVFLLFGGCRRGQ
jgi:mitogen-activated protein kinase kinase